MGPAYLRLIAASPILSLAAASCSGTSTGGSSSSAYCGPSMVEYNTSQALAVGTTSATLGGVKLAQSFSPATDLSITEVDLGLIRVGSPTNSTLTLSITPTSAEGSTGNPTNTPLTNATATYAVTTDPATATETIKTTPELYTFTMAGTVSLTANNTYWLVLSADYDSTTDYIQWLASDSSGFSGISKYYRIQNVPGWYAPTVPSKDFTFRFRCATASPSPSPSPSATLLR